MLSLYGINKFNVWEVLSEERFRDLLVVRVDDVSSSDVEPLCTIQTCMALTEKFFDRIFNLIMQHLQQPDNVPPG